MLELDQVGLSEKIININESPAARLGRSMRVISITSGKGGVGKSSVVSNLSIALGARGYKVLLLDGDFGLANLDIMLDLKSRGNLHDVLSNGYSISDILVNAAPGVDVIPASSGILEMTNLGIQEKSKLIDSMQELENSYDVLLIDTGAGISEDVTWLNASAGEIIVVATPEPTSIADAYALIKVLNQKYKIKQFKLLVNQVKNEAEGLRVYQQITGVSDKFLHVGIDYLGHILWDECLTQAVRIRKPIIQAFPNAKASKNFCVVADTLFSKSYEQRTANGNLQFFWKALLGHA